MSIIASVFAFLLNCTDGSTYCQIRQNYPSLSITYAHELADIIEDASEKYDIPAKIYTAILMQESRYTLDVVACKKTCDYGISQINEHTARSYGYDIYRLRNDLRYSVFAGAEVLSWFKINYAHKEDKWWCRYNVGTAKLERIQKLCDVYVNYVERYIK